MERNVKRFAFLFKPKIPKTGKMQHHRSAEKKGI